MSAPTLLTKILLVAALAVLVAIGAVFYLWQNSTARAGGKISRPKMLWLTYVVGLWFFVCPIVALDPTVAVPLRATLGGFAAFMWMRGLTELLMMYLTKNWRPRYGIAHNIASFVLVTAMAAWSLTSGLASYDAWVFGLVVLVAVTLVIETVFAVGFRRVVGDRTTGDDAVWFASAKDERFAGLNRLTAALNVPVYGLLALFLVRSVLL